MPVEPSRPSRRRVVTALTALLAVPASVAGCTRSGPASRSAPVDAATTPPTRSPAESATDGSETPHADVALLTEVAAATDAVVARYEAVLRRHVGLRGELRPLLVAHRAHAAALGDAAPPGASTPSSATTPAPSRSTGPPPEVPARPGAAVRALRTVERTVQRELLDATARAASGDFARLLASMSAASAQHLRVLAAVETR